MMCKNINASIYFEAFSIKIKKTKLKYSLMKLFMTILFCFCLSVKGQNHIEKRIEGTHIQKVDVNGDGVFKIKIDTHDSTQIIVTASVEGEHSEHIILVTEEIEDLLIVSAEWQPLFIQDNNKLSAHKVISIELEMLLPKTISLYAKSDIASAEIKGEYNRLMVELVNGNCNIQAETNYTKVNTIDGDISVLTQNAAIKANTKNGKMDVDNAVKGNNTMLLNSLNGDIKVRKQ